MTNALPPPPHARVGDSVRVVGSAVGFMLAALMRRAVGRRRRPAWSITLEATIAAYRGAWSTMPALGIVRWRNVGEALTPLAFDGLDARVVRHEGASGTVLGAWLDPPDASDAVLLYFHGGGYCFASLRTHGPMIGALARATRARTFAFEYRLAPEHPAPAAGEDALAAYRYLLAEGIPPNRIVFAGDSAGGTMVLNALVALRDAREPLPAGAVAIAPWVDLGCSGGSFQYNDTFDFVGETHCRLAAQSYLAGADPKRPDISPLFADLRGLPPLLVQAGEAEVLVDQIRVFARQAADAGVDVRLHVYEDMVHVWHMMQSATPRGAAGHRRDRRVRARMRRAVKPAGNVMTTPASGSRLHTRASLIADFRELGLHAGMTVMVHSSLGRVGYTVGGPGTVIEALLAVLGDEGTLVMPAESPQLNDPAAWNDPRVRAEWHDTIREHLPVFDRRTTPTTMGAIPEAFRTWPGTLRSDHPLVSVSANGRHAAAIVAEQPLAFCEGPGSPFERLYDLDAHTLLLGVGFNRCTSLHFAESLVPQRRTQVSRMLAVVDGTRAWIDVPNVASDGGLHFPEAGRRFMAAGHVRKGRVGDADSLFFSTRALVDFGAAYFADALPR